MREGRSQNGGEGMGENRIREAREKRVNKDGEDS